MKSQILLLSCFLGTLMNQAAVASTPNPYLEFSLEQLMQVSITGSTLRDESLKTVPSAATVFTREQLDRLGMDYLYELLNLVPGYQFDRNGDSPAGYTFSARGRRNSSEAREVLLLVDGRVFADPRTGGADGSLPLFPLAEIERVEIIRGPGSALYGSNAFNGVINIVTRKGVNSLTVSAGSQTRRAAQIQLSTEYRGWDGNGFVRFYEDEGERYAISADSTTDSLKSVDLDFSLGNNETTLRAAYHRVASKDFYIGETLGGDADDNVNHYVQLFKHLSIEHKFSLADSVQTRIALSYVDIQQDFDFMALPAGQLTNLSQPMSDDPLFADGVIAGETARFTVANDWTVDAKTSVQFGLDWHKNNETKARVNNNFDVAQLALGDLPINYYGDLSRQTIVGKELSQTALGLYAQYLRNLGEYTKLTVGMRYDDYSHVGAHLSPRLGLVQQITDNHTIKILYGEAYRAPSLSETGLQNNPTLVGNPDLDYEIVQSWDLIWLGTWRNFIVSVDGFQNDYTQPIATGFSNAVRTYINGADERSTGVEVEASQQITDRWLARLTHTDFIDLPDSAFREAKYLSSIMINYDSAQWNWNLAAVHHSSRNELVSNGTQTVLPSYWFANTRFIYHINQTYDVNLQIKNIFNNQFSTPTQGKEIPMGIPNRGREFEIGLSWRLN